MQVQQRMASQIRRQERTPQRLVSLPPPQGTQWGSLTQQRDEEEGEEDEKDEEDEGGGDDEAYEYATKKLLYHDMHDEEINLDLNKCYMWVDCHEIKIIEIYIVIKVYLMCKFIIKSNYTLKCLFHYPKNIN